MRRNSPSHYGMAQDTYQRIADHMTDSAVRGRVEPCIIRQDINSGLLVVDLNEYNKVYTADTRFTEGFLVINFNYSKQSRAVVVYASVDGHYVRRASALQRFRNLSGTRQEAAESQQ